MIGLILARFGHACGISAVCVSMFSRSDAVTSIKTVEFSASLPKRLLVRAVHPWPLMTLQEAH